MASAGSSEAVQQGLAIRLGAGVAGEVRSPVWPHFLLENTWVSSVLKLQDPARYTPCEPQRWPHPHMPGTLVPSPLMPGPSTDNTEPSERLSVRFSLSISFSTLLSKHLSQHLADFVILLRLSCPLPPCPTAQGQSPVANHVRILHVGAWGKL